MAFTPINDLVAMVINELSQVPGVVTQKYSAPVITQYIQNAYMLESQEIWWPDYMFTFQNVSIDPLTGLPTTDLVGPISGIDDYGDIQYVWPQHSNRPLSALPDTVNPANVIVSSSSNTPSSPVYITPDFTIPNRPFRVLPSNSVGPVAVRARQHTDFPFTNSTKVGIDPLLLMFDAAWQYCVNDGTLPAQVAKYELLIRKRRQQMISNFNSQSLPLDNRVPQTTTGWMEGEF